MAEILIDYKNVSISRQDLNILKDIKVTIEKGEFVYLIGRVGSGKSSFMKTMYAEVSLQWGEATVLGYKIDKLKKKHIPFLRRKIGIVFQDFQLLTDRTIYANLEFVLKATGWKRKYEIEERIESVLKRVEMNTKGYKMPHQLSGGEQQRIVIARALLNDPEIILADEPTGNLDPETGMQIVSLLHEISNSGTTVIMATHNHALTHEFPGRILCVEDQQLIDLTAEEKIEEVLEEDSEESAENKIKEERANDENSDSDDENNEIEEEMTFFA